jgi:hypothetical protein
MSSCLCAVLIHSKLSAGPVYRPHGEVVSGVSHWCLVLAQTTGGAVGRVSKSIIAIHIVCTLLLFCYIVFLLLSLVLSKTL